MDVTLGGWVKNKRDLGGVRFIIMQDKYGDVQVTAKKDVVGEKIFNQLNLGFQDCILVRGKLKKFAKAPNGVELIPSEVKILNKAPEKLPIDITGVTDSELDLRLDNRVLDLRNPRNQAVFQIQHVLLKSIRDYLCDQNFTEIVTPKIIGSATEGGTELFPIMYFDKEAFLSQSAQLYKEQLVSDFEKVFELGACYRAEKSRTKRHLCEIYTLDLEIAFADQHDVMNVLENLIHYCHTQIKEKCESELKSLKRWETFEVPEVPFPRYSYTEILHLLEKKANFKIPWGEDISTEAYRELEKILPSFYFIPDWPMSMKPFYIMKNQDDPKISQGFDLQKGWLELVSGGTRVHNKEVLAQQLREKKLNPASFESHLRAFDFGMPPHAGCGLGIGRWLLIITGVEDIREAIFFPRTPDRLTP
ncbi:MAG: aspartyl-tRNA synthetase [Promethearchaeota archaeon CR_4]|nr:MAG: aspartyl-tRNA synthetase [Candidatus Lokiarchaeota archaeon CR_4]